MAGSRSRSLEMQMIVDTFLDKERVLKAWDQGKIKALSSAGALVRYIAQRSIKPARRKSLSDMTDVEKEEWKKLLRRARRQGKPRPRRPFVSAPAGKPPYNKTGLLKKFIYFGRDPKTDEMYVGAVAVGGLRTARLLEHGGQARLWGSDQRMHQMNYKGNPFMGPALDEASPKIPPMFKDVVKADAVALTRGPRG